jgi:hypothetical protein
VVVGIRRLKRQVHPAVRSKTGGREGVDEDTEAEFEKLNTRIEALVGGIAALADVVQLTHSMVCNLAEWLKEPPSTDLPKLLRQIVAKLDALPSEVARAVSPGELHRR